MGWSFLAKACMLAYVVLLICCVAENPSAWIYALFAPLLITGVYAEYRADKARRVH